ncbi:helix-turn-helix transcriptional regulator [Aeromicrobium sp.]|uniref:helix-turn-helix transcriptional regulator n=1 Tax=Aeromicrobium sp. TaxID=1871063 RepID=UPI003D6AC06A
MGDATERTNRDMLRVRDAIDRDFADELDLTTLAALAHVSPDHLVRTFRSVFGETPHRYLQRRRIERAMFLLRTSDLPVTDVCLQVGYTSLGAFSELFTGVVGQSPSAYRAVAESTPAHASFVMAWTRPSTHTHPSISRKRRPSGGD